MNVYADLAAVWLIAAMPSVLVAVLSWRGYCAKETRRMPTMKVHRGGQDETRIQIE